MKPDSYYKSLDKRTKEYKEWKASRTIDVPVMGLGDAVDKVTKATGIKKIVEIFSKGKDCGCDERKKKLNAIPILTRKARCLTEQEFNTWSELKLSTKKSLSNEERKTLCKMYADVFSVPYYEPCVNCSSKPYLTMIKHLDIVYNTYLE